MNGHRGADGQGNDAFLQKLANHRLLDAAEERGLVRRSQAGGAAATEQIVRLNCRLVLSIARQYCGLGIDLADLFQYGCIGLIKAVAKFDLRRPEKPRLSTYADWWIRSEIRKALRDHSRTIRLPARVADDVVALKRRRDGAARPKKRGERPGSAKTAAGRLEPERLKRAESAARLETISLDAWVNDEKTTTFLNFLSSPPADVIARIDLDRDRRRLARILTGLKPTHAAVIRGRFALDLTLDQTADLLEAEGVTAGRLSRERVRQIEVLALAELRAGFAEAGPAPKDR